MEFQPVMEKEKRKKKRKGTVNGTAVLPGQYRHQVPNLILT
jgi:hypothetical protein